MLYHGEQCRSNNSVLRRPTCDRARSGAVEDPRADIAPGVFGWGGEEWVRGEVREGRVFSAVRCGFALGVGAARWR